MLNYLVFTELVLIGLFGGLANYTVNMAKGHIQCNFLTYLSGAFTATLASLGAIVMAAIGVMQSGAVDLGSPTLFVLMFSSGYICDNTANRAPTP